MEHLESNLKRVIPVLTLKDEKLVKTVRFKKPNYIGDPVNAVKIFNEKEVDEIILLDISPSRHQREPNYKKIEEICSEAFMPFAYGGGVHTIDQIQKLFKLGLEKVVLNSSLANGFDLMEKAVKIFGSQSIIASIDVRKSRFQNKYSAYTQSGKVKIKSSLDQFIRDIQSAGAGELFLNSIERDGSYLGYDLKLINSIAHTIDIPLVVCGGASGLKDFKMALNEGASAVAAGSLFVYKGKSKGILINYPSPEDLKNEVYS